eukprot:4458050-Amphidinium_carterae.1
MDPTVSSVWAAGTEPHPYWNCINNHVEGHPETPPEAFTAAHPSGPNGDKKFTQSNAPNQH